MFLCDVQVSPYIVIIVVRQSKQHLENSRLGTKLNSSVTVKSKRRVSITFTIYTVQGKMVVISMRALEDNVSLQYSIYCPGLYILKVLSSDVHIRSIAVIYDVYIINDNMHIWIYVKCISCHSKFRFILWLATLIK